MPGRTFDYYLAAFNQFAERLVHDRATAHDTATLFDMLAGTLQDPNMAIPTERPENVPPITWDLTHRLISAVRSSANTPERRADAILAAQTSASVLRAQFPD